MGGRKTANLAKSFLRNNMINFEHLEYMESIGKILNKNSDNIKEEIKSVNASIQTASLFAVIIFLLTLGLFIISIITVVHFW